MKLKDKTLLGSGLGQQQSHPSSQHFMRSSTPLEGLSRTTYNGTAHSTPSPWLDISTLVTRYSADRLTLPWADKDHEGVTKKVRAVKHTLDVWDEGAHSLRGLKGFEEWKESRKKAVSDKDLWEEDEKHDQDVPSGSSEEATSGGGLEAAVL